MSWVLMVKEFRGNYVEVGRVEYLKFCEIYKIRFLVFWYYVFLVKYFVLSTNCLFAWMRTLPK